MADPRATLLASVARQQADARLAVGDVLVRDGEAVLLTKVGPRVEWRSASGADEGAPLGSFAERAFDEVPLDGAPAVYLDDVWRLASSTGIPRDVRVLAVGRAARRAPTEQDALTVRRWAATLSGGMEPRRSP